LCSLIGAAMIDPLPMASPNLRPITVLLPVEQAEEFRAAARAELGPMPARNGDAAAVTVLRRLIAEYIKAGGAS
jgi:hypothetical protein